MLKIVEAKKETSELKKFKEEEWSTADLEHYGTTELDFNKHEVTLVAELENQIVGYINIELESGVCYIDSLIVSSKHQRKGIGKDLVKKAEERAKKQGCHKITLETGADWRARKLYEKLEYKIVAELNNYYHNKDFILMDKDL